MDLIPLVHLHIIGVRSQKRPAVVAEDPQSPFTHQSVYIYSLAKMKPSLIAQGANDYN
jgi:hypothetical protein